MELKERIREKAAELYRKFGVRSVTMDEIASQLGVSKKTIYQCYCDKSELVNEVMAHMLQLNKTRCNEGRVHAKNAIHEAFVALEFIGEIISNMDPSILFDIERSYPACYQKFADFKYDFLYDIMVRNLEWGIEDELYRSDISIEIIAKMRLEALSLPFNTRLFPKNRFTLIEVHKEFLMFYLHGLATPKGIKLINHYRKQYAEKTEKSRKSA